MAADKHMQNRIQIKKLVAILLAVMVSVVMCYFMTYEETHTIHDCTGEGCPICHELQIAGSFVRQFATIFGASMAFFFVAVRGIHICAAASGFISKRTLISDKVRIDA